MDHLSLELKPLPPTFSLQDALSPTSSSPPLVTLYKNGCIQTDGATNCTAACTDSSQAFRTLESLHNCVLYNPIADAYANQNLSSNDTKLADDFVIREINSLISHNVNSTITACFNAYCDPSPDCTVLMPPKIYLTDGGWDGYYSRSTADMLCGHIARSVSFNTDIGGIGVYASYWIQSGLALLGTFLVLLWGRGTHYACDPNTAGRRGNNATKSAKGLPVTFKDRRLAHLTAALTDFQKAQCFFVLAVNIAALANKANGGLLPVSLQQLYDNYSLLASITISGCLPITATLLALHMVDMISGYLLALSGSTVALSIATIAAIGNFKPSRGDRENIQAQVSKGTYTECGGFDLTVYCLQYQDNDEDKNYVWGIMAYCLIVLFYIFAYHLKAFGDPLTHQARPWVLRMASYMSSVRTWQLTLPIVSLSFGFDFVFWSLTLACLAFVSICRLRCTRRINSALLTSIRCGFDLLACVSWLAVFSLRLSFLAFFIWVTFVISTVQLLRKAYVEDTKIRKWTFQYRRFAYRDEILPTVSSSNRSMRSHFRKSLTIIMKASVILTTLIFVLINRLEERADSHDWPRKFRRFLVFCLYWIIFLGCIVSFVFVFQGLYLFRAKVDMRTWTFGQIVAITVWAPPLCEYIHLELLGMTHGFQHRLLPPYKILTTVTPALPVP